MLTRALQTEIYVEIENTTTIFTHLYIYYVEF